MLPVERGHKDIVSALSLPFKGVVIPFNRQDMEPLEKLHHPVEVTGW